MQIDREQISTARISVTVAEFDAIGGGRGCSHVEIELTDTGNGKVSQAGINAPIVVSAAVYLEFFVHAREGDRYAYMPVGIGFRNVAGIEHNVAMTRPKEGNRGDPLGNAAFPVRQVVAKGNTTQLTLHDTNLERAEFDFSLVIQRSDGLLSVVDPQIRNSGPLR